VLFRSLIRKLQELQRYSLFSFFNLFQKSILTSFWDWQQEQATQA